MIAASPACSLARAASSVASAESEVAWVVSRSLLAISSRRKSSLLRSRSRFASVRPTCARDVWARDSAWAARAFSTSARARSTWACWLSTAACEPSTSARAWLTLASNVSGSMRAMTWPLRTMELKSTMSCLIWPETWLPTWTVVTALRVPVADTAAVRGPRSTRPNRYCGALPPLWT